MEDGAVGTPQQTVLRQDARQDNHSPDKCCDAGIAQPSPFSIGEGHDLLRSHLTPVFAQPRFYPSVGDPGTQEGDQKGGDSHEVVVGSRHHIIVRVNDIGSLGGETRQQRVDGADQQVGTEAAAHTSKGGGHTGDGMPAQ